MKTCVSGIHKIARRMGGTEANCSLRKGTKNMCACEYNTNRWQTKRISTFRSNKSSQADYSVSANQTGGYYRAMFSDVMFINKPFQIETLQRAPIMKPLSQASNRQLLVSLITITMQGHLYQTN